MSASVTRSHEELLEALFKNLIPHFPKNHQADLQILISRLYGQASFRDLEKYQISDLGGMVITLWHALQQRVAGKAHVDVINPNVEEHEWQSQHSIVTVVHDEVPFVIDSARMLLNRRGLSIHSIFYADIYVQRKDGKLQGLSEKAKKGYKQELLLCMEMDRTSDAKEQADIEKGLRSVLEDVDAVVAAYPQIVEKTKETIKDLGANKYPVGQEVVDEAKIYMEWINSNHFTFLAYDEYLIEDGCVKQVPGSALGLFEKTKDAQSELISEMSAERQERVFKQELLVFTKSSRRSTVHRPAYSDYIVVKRFDDKGQVIGGRRFMGLYTSSVYNQTPKDIPVIRKKINQVLANSGFAEGSHSYKELSGILYTFPRDELILCEVENLLRITTEVLRIQERKQIRLFLRQDAYSKFLSAIVYMPRDVFNTQVRIRVHDMLAEIFDVEGSDFTTFFSESVLARTRFVFKLKNPLSELPPTDVLEDRIAAIARRWTDELQSALIESFGEENGIDLHKAYEKSFPSGYLEQYSARVAVADIQRIENLHANKKQEIGINFFRYIEPTGSMLKLKLFNKGQALLLSDLVPVLENLGLRVIDEFPYEVQHPEYGCTWIYDFNLSYAPEPDLDPSDIREAFSTAFLNIWEGHAENDRYNQLVLRAKFGWRQVAMLRAYAKYMKQTRFGLSMDYIAQTLIQHTEITAMLAQYFSLRFDPNLKRSEKKLAALSDKIEQALDDVDNINEDRIIHRYLELIEATVRTNYYQAESGGESKDYISFKLDPGKISNIPLPKPRYEIFVYSPRVEGVHLRGGMVSRGGLRWSDRNEDFRTEVLGLVKAQQVKNAVIVPVGAKGGFVAKQLPPPGDRDAFMAEGIRCYKTFIRGLLDVTDNLVDNKVVPPKSLVRYDGDDPYLVVAADKGTASFSDIANEVAISYDFWLGDAFASGGSNGYDHKKMGITARGAWVSVQRHFRELGIDVQSDTVTAVGIGDMSGDVFGNGLLRSESVKLVGAFNHLHIFVDPDPDAAKGFKERERMFGLARSTWDDYDKKLISKGGGVFSRSAKSIAISPEMKQVFDIKEDKLTPNDLISAMLRSPVDLIWNGGIGTYVKAASETDAEIGDKANDAVRVNGSQLRCKVIGEGGNLGFSQLGRVEFSLNGGRCFTDFIDNAGGVDCSDHEVNMKILLDDLVANGDMTVKQRNQTLEKYTEDVSDLVLRNNYRQTQCLGIAHTESYRRVEEYRRLICTLESEGKLNRELELLPSDDGITDRKANDQGLTRPELSVLVSYVKGDLKEQLAHSALSEDTFVSRIVETEFPHDMRSKFAKQMHEHRLHKEIVATQVANDMVNYLGITVFNRLHESTGATPEEAARAYIAAREIFSLHALWDEIEALDYQISSELQSKMMLRTQRMARRGTRWLVKNFRTGIDIEQAIKLFKPAVEHFNQDLESMLPDKVRELWHKDRDSMVKQGVPEALAQKVAASEFLYISLGIVAVAENMKQKPGTVAHAYFKVGEELGLESFARQVNSLTVASHWQAMARESYRDDLEWQQRRITQGLFVKKKEIKGDMDAVIAAWLEENTVLVERWLKMLNEIKAANEPEFSMYSVAIRELLDLSQATMPEF